MIELYSTEMRDVKSRTGTLRAERAAATRRRILAAARTRFGNPGYGATTLTDIAAAAGVAVQTVYAVFGSKAGILRVLRDQVVEDPDATLAYGAALAAEDPAATLRWFARSIRLRWEAGHDIVNANTKAAAADPAIRAELQSAVDARRRGIKRLAEHLGNLTHVDADRADALLDALTMTETYEQLVAVHRWSPDEYESWLGDALVALILDREGPRPAD